MRTTMDLPKGLVSKAMKAVGVRTKKAAVVMGLEELIRQKEIQGLKAFKGKIKLDIDLDALRDRK